MAKRVYELAKELNLTNKEVLEKIKALGIPASSHMNVLSENDSNAIRQALGQAGKGKGYAGGKPASKEAAPEGQNKPRENRGQSEQKRPQGQKRPHGDQTGEGQGSTKQQQPKKEQPAQKDRQFRSQASSSNQQDHRSQMNKGRQQSQRTPSTPSSTPQSRDSKETQSSQNYQSAQQGRASNPNQGRPRGQKGTGQEAQKKSVPGRSGKQESPTQKQSQPEKRNQDRRMEKKNEAGFDQNRNQQGYRKPKTADNKRKNVELARQKQAQKRVLKKEQRKEAARIAEEEANLIASGTKIITVPITVKGLAEQIDVSTSTIIMKLMKLGIMANINQNLDEDTVQILGEELDVSLVIGKVEEDVVEEGIENFEDREEDLKSRPPIITVMGHVDHGKTSLLDRIRSTNVTESESGGITQHIGASEVRMPNGQRIVLLDTPGHEAFTAMRARGAHVTDIAILVVAADDSVKPQTIEAISHAKAANVPIIVAINKIDKPGADPDRVKKDLSQQGVLIEEWGGDVICVPVSAKTGEGIDTLLEMVLLQAEVLELKANPNRLALGTVIEARLDKARGVTASLLILNGTLHAGMSIVAGKCSGRIKAMVNYKGESIKKAGPATPVEILGLTDVPEAGDQFNAVSTDKLAREIAENRKNKQREEVMKRNSSVTLEQLFSQIEHGEVKDLNLIIKADVMGSVGALITSLERLSTENVAVKIIHTGVGTVTESDIMLASTSNAIIIGFNIRPSSSIMSMAERDGVEIRTYRIIYEVIDEIEAAIKGMLDPEYKEVVLGTIEIRNTFKVPGVGIIGGAYVQDGKVERNAQIRLVRDGIVIHEGKISSLKRFKDDAKEVAKGYECGIGIENYNDIKEGDIIEAFKMVEIER